MDDSIHPSQRVHLVRDLAGLRHVGEVPDHQLGPPVEEVADRVDTIGVAYVDDDIVSVPEQLLCRCPAEAVGRSGDQDAHVNQPTRILFNRFRWDWPGYSGADGLAWLW